MAVPVQTPYIEYTANGSAKSFALEFDCENQDHLIVLVDEVEPIVGTWSFSNGAVVFGTAPTSGKKITIQRNTPASRSTEYKSFDNSFRPGSINKDFDRAWWKIQELGVADWLLGLKIQKFRDDVNLTALENTLEEAKQIRDDTADSVIEVQSNVEQSTILLADTTAQAEAAATSATDANTAKAQAETAATDATTQVGTLKTYVDSAVGAISTDASKQYATLALANADIANIALNKNIFVSEAANGGYWYKDTAGATILTKSPYDAVEQAKADATTKANAAEANAKAHVDTNDGATRYDSSAFYEAKYYNVNGTGTASALAAATDLIPVKAGDKVSVFTKVSSSTYAAILVYNSAGTFVRAVVPSVFSTPTETTTIIETDGFVRSQWMAGGTPLTDKDGVAKVVINEGTKRFLTDELLPNAAAPLLAVKADKYQVSTLDNSTIVVGGVDTYGGETTSNLRARSIVYKFNTGDIVDISRPTGSAFQFGWNTASTDIVPFNNGLFRAPTAMQFTIESGLEYVRIAFRKTPESEITALDLETIKSQVIIKVNDKVVYNTDLAEAAGKLEARIATIENEPVHTLNSNYRASSEATGGLVSFIDDDGKTEVYTVLSPLYKGLNVPFASAIVPDRVGTTEYMTLAQIKELAADTYNFETMNHTFSHQNLGNLTAPEIHDQVQKAKRWLRDSGFLDDGFVLPYGSDNALVRKIVAQYYNSCYDFSNDSKLFLTFDNIQNALIKRTDFGLSATRLADHKAIIDNISANGGWVVITTHVLNDGYWDANSAADLTELINYIQAKGCKIVTPRDGFQAMGNLVENDSGFKIAANGKIIGAS